MNYFSSMLPLAAAPLMVATVYEMNSSLPGLTWSQMFAFSCAMAQAALNHDNKNRKERDLFYFLEMSKAVSPDDKQKNKIKRKIFDSLFIIFLFPCFLWALLIIETEGRVFPWMNFALITIILARNEEYRRVKKQIKKTLDQ